MGKIMGKIQKRLPKIPAVISSKIEDLPAKYLESLGEYL